MNKRLVQMRRIMAFLLALALAFTGIMPVSVYASETSSKATNDKLGNITISEGIIVPSAEQTVYQDPIYATEIPTGAIT